jgi:hypothetical protein
MCQDKSTSSQLIPIVSILLTKLSSEVKNPVNSVFRDDIGKMLEDGRKRLNVLLENEFLVISSLLDPRYTIKMEQILNKQFRDYVDDIMKLLKSFQEEELQLEDIDENHIGPTACDSENLQENDFWNVSGQSTSNSQMVQKQGVENKIEVKILKFLIT